MNNRASILRRPIRSAHPGAGESAEREYQMEQARLQAKRERYQSTQNFVRTMINPSLPEKKMFQAEMSDAMSMQLEERRQKERESRAKDLSEPNACPIFLSGGESGSRARSDGSTLGQQQHPLGNSDSTAPSIAGGYAHHHQPSSASHPRPGSAASRAMAREMLEENKRLAALRSMEKANARREELARAKEDARHWDSSSQFYR